MNIPPQPENCQYVSMEHPMTFVPIQQGSVPPQNCTPPLLSLPPLTSVNDQYLFSTPQYAGAYSEPIQHIQYIYPNINSPRKYLATVPPGTITAVEPVIEYTMTQPQYVCHQPYQYANTGPVYDVNNNSRGITEFATTMLSDKLDKEELKFMQEKLEKLDNQLTDIIAKKTKKWCF